MEKSTELLFSSHHPDRQFLKENCHHFYCEVLSIASFIASPSHSSPSFRHSHSPYEFLIPYGPLPMIMYENSIYFGEAGYVYPVQSGRDHASKYKVTNVAHDNITVDKKFLEEILRERGLAGKEFNLRFALSKEHRLYIQLFKEEYQKTENCDHKKLLHLAALLVRSFIESEFCLTGERSLNPPQYQQGVLQIASYMNQHYTEEIQIETLASMCGLSKTYFISSFKKVIGEPPYNYLLRLRTGKARILLETTTLSIKQIADSCGFQRANTFTSLFKSMTGMSPTEYRKQN